MPRIIGIRRNFVIAAFLGMILVQPGSSQTSLPNQAAGAPGLVFGATSAVSGLSIQDSAIGSGLYPFADLHPDLELRFRLVSQFGFLLAYSPGLAVPIPLENLSALPRGYGYHRVRLGAWAALALPPSLFPAEAVEFQLSGGVSFASYDYTYLYFLFPDLEAAALFRKSLGSDTEPLPLSFIFGPRFQLSLRKDPGTAFSLGIHAGLLVHFP